ncbi:MAG: acetylxylan esterase [Euryarchaeota archaeon]|nr:acetylxylan esterase [Euryarchaeota archaeon]
MVDRNTTHNTIRKFILVIGLFLILAGGWGISHDSDSGSTWSLSDDGTLTYSQMGDIDYTIYDIDINNNSNASKNTDATTNNKDRNHSSHLVTFTSRNTDILSILTLPQIEGTVPGIVILPGAGVTKEDKQDFAAMLASMGYASLTLDQRNLGRIDPQHDLEVFRAGNEPVEYMMVHDVLKAVDVLRDQPAIDEERIAIMGFSNGGRFAIIATAIDPSIKGVVAVSTCGYGTGSIDPGMVADTAGYEFYRSIDPDTYIGKISPRRTVMIHSFNDTIIEYDAALATFMRAGEPKAMYNISDHTHGYTGSMSPCLEKGLSDILE